MANGTGKFRDTQGFIKVTWLFHLISVRMNYESGKLKWQARIAWIKLNKPKKTRRHKKSKKRSKAERSESTSIYKEQAERPQGQTVHVEEKPKQARENEEQKEKGRFKGLREKIRNFFDKIKYTIKNIYDKIKAMNEKREKAIIFLEEEVHKKALVKLKEQGVKLLKKLVPKKFTAAIIIGFEDPSITGYFLAGYSMAFPFLPKSVNVQPDFESKVFKGPIMMKGHVRGFQVVRFIWKMVWDQDVRQTYQDIREIEI